MTLTSKLISPPPVVYDANVKRKASAPISGIPRGKEVFWYCLALAISFSSRLLVNNFAWRDSRSIPLIMSIGSMTLPRLLLIFLPSESRIRLWQYTSVKGTLLVSFSDNMIIRAIQKKSMSQPDSSKVVGKNLVKSGCDVSGQPRMAMGHRPELNQVLQQSQY